MRSPINNINRLHKFLESQTVYPILLSTLFALALYVARVLQSHSFAYMNLVWNLFLAWVPFWLSIWAAGLHNNRPGRWWVLIFPGILWLIFFPNAPYIITDFLHLSDRPRIPMWYDILMLATFAWTGCFLAIASLRSMQIIVKDHIGWVFSWAFAAIALCLGGLGIYLGRFSRWNSWDIFISPNEILSEVLLKTLNPLSNLRFFGFTILFSSFLLICYLMFITIRKEPQLPNKQGFQTKDIIYRSKR